MDFTCRVSWLTQQSSQIIKEHQLVIQPQRLFTELTVTESGYSITVFRIIIITKHIIMVSCSK